MKTFLLSVIVPAYNEEASIEQSLKAVFAAKPLKEVIVVNDASTDKTKEILEKIQQEMAVHKPAMLKELRVVHKQHNEGKGAAIRTAVPMVMGDIVLIQDADLELDPNEYSKLIEPFEKLGASVVFGSRFRREGIMRVHNTVHFLGNKRYTSSLFFMGVYRDMYHGRLRH